MELEVRGGSYILVLVLVFGAFICVLFIQDKILGGHFAFQSRLMIVDKCFERIFILIINAIARM